MAVLTPVLVVYVGLAASIAVVRPLSDDGGLGLTSLRMLTSVGLCLAPMAVWPFRVRGYAFVAGVGLSVLALINLVHVFEYSDLVTIGAIDAVANTTAREAGEFVRGRAGSVLAAGVAAAVLLSVTAGAMWQIPSSLRMTQRGRVGAAVLGGLSAVLLLVMPMRLFPLSTVKNAADYVTYQQRMEAARAERERMSFGATAAPGALAEDPIVVLVVGESMRRRQLGLYGYPRETTPWLDGAEGLVVFSDVVSTSSGTQEAVGMMMTAAEPETFTDHAERSWLTLAREIGYDTVWLSNQDRTGGSTTALIAEDAERVIYTSHSWMASGQLDEDLLPELDRTLARRDGPLAMVLHLMGSHDAYRLRYPPAFHTFTVASPRTPLQAGLSAREQALIDDYDNSVRYTDWILGQVIERIEAAGGPAALVFVSDHGEMLFDAPARVRGHGLPRMALPEVEVPMVVWTSEAFGAQRPEVVQAARRNRARPASSGDLFYAMGDLVGAEWEGDRPGRSVFASDYRPRPRRVLLRTMHPVELAALEGDGIAR